MTRRRWIVVGTVLALVLAAFVWIWLQPSDRILRQADGREIILKAVTYGTVHRHVEGPPWARALAPLVPASWHRGIRARVLTVKTAQPSLVAWLQWRGGSSNQREIGEASVGAEQGIHSEPVGVRTTLYLQDKPWGAIRAWEFAAFPRRERELVLRFYSRDGGYNPVTEAEFRVTNPARRPLPEEPAPPLPLTRTNGPWEFTLTRLQTGEKIPNHLHFRRGWIAPWNRAAFRVRRGSVDAPEWTVESISARDAAGDVIPFNKGEAARDGGGIEFGWNAPLWPSEPAWQLKVEFARTGGFEPAEMLELKAVTVPAPRAPGQTMIQTQAVLQGATLKVKSLGRHFPPGSMDRMRTDLVLDLDLMPLDGRRLVLVRAMDDHGRVLPHLKILAQPSGAPTLWFKVEDDARTVDLTLAVERSRFVEFIARPEVAGTNVTR